MLTASEAVRRCSAAHAALVLEKTASGRLPLKASQPWDDEYSEWWKKRDKYLRTEYHD